MAEWLPKLTLKTEPVLKLFTGENFYSSPDAALREAVLNAIDAIGRRKETDLELEPQISVEFDRDNRVIQISDNGIGMDRKDLSNLYTKIGASAANVNTPKLTEVHIVFFNAPNIPTSAFSAKLSI